MYSVDEIFARLQNGETAEKIANEMADAINEAVARSEQEAANQEKKKAIQAAAENVLSSFNELLSLYGLTGTTVTTQDIIDIVEAMINIKDSFHNFTLPKERKKENVKRNRDADAVINDFLDAWGL